MSHPPTDSSRYDCPPDEYWGDGVRDVSRADYEDRDMLDAEWKERWRRLCLERSLAR